jgi:hypothetical protein
MGADQAGRIDGLDPAPSRDLGGLAHVLGQLVGDDQAVAHLRPRGELEVLLHGFHFIEAVLDLGVEADGAVGGDGPRRGGPDHDAGVIGRQTEDVVAGRITRQRIVLLVIDLDRELHPDRGADVVVVFDLGVGQGRALDGAPHHGLGAAIELARRGELVELGDDRGLGRVVHGGVAVPPVAEDAQALELDLLGLDPAASIFAAAGAEFLGRDLVLAAALGAELFLDLPLDRQAVTVPAGHVVDVVAQGEARADHEVLQRLVQGVADVDRAIGVGRAVVQHEQRGAVGLALGADRAVQALVGEGGPALQDLGLLLGQATAHWERGVGKEDGFAIVAGGRGVVGHGRAIQLLEVRKNEVRGCWSRRALETRPATSRRADNSRGFPNESHGAGDSRAERRAQTASAAIARV